MTDDALRSLDDLEAALPRAGRWQIRGQDAALCVEVGGARVELTPRGRRRCELRAVVSHATLRRLLRALEAERPAVPAPDAIDVQAELEPVVVAAID